MTSRASSPPKSSGRLLIDGGERKGEQIRDRESVRERRYLRIRDWLKYGLESKRGDALQLRSRDRIYETVNFWPMRKRIIRQISHDLLSWADIVIFLAQPACNFASKTGDSGIYVARPTGRTQ